MNAPCSSDVKAKLRPSLGELIVNGCPSSPATAQSTSARGVSGVSGVVGAGLGLAGVQLLRFVIPAGSAYQSPPVFEPVTMVTLTLSLVVVAIVAGLVPAIRAARIPPAEALRAA